MTFFLLLVSIFLMFLQPTFIFPSLLNYSPIKYFSIAALLSYIFINNKHKKQYGFFYNCENKVFLIFIFLQVISSATIWFSKGLYTLTFWSKYAIIYFLIIKLTTSIFRIKVILFAIISAISYLSFYSVTTFVIKYETGMRAGGFGWYENSNDLSIILVSIIPLTYLFFEITPDKKRIIFISLAFIYCFNLLFTGSRNGLLGLLTVGTLSIILSNVSKIIKFILISLLLTSIFGIGLSIVLSRNDLSGLSGDDSSEHRLKQWSACLEMIKSHPILGVGPGEVVGEMKHYGGIRGLAPHNTILYAFAETGVFGGLAFTVFGLLPLLKFFNRKNLYLIEDSIEYVIYKYLCISLSGYWICAFFSNRIMGYQLYILVALIVSVTNIIESKKSQNIK